VKYRYRSGGREYQITIDRTGGEFHATVDGKSYDVEILDSQPGQISLLFENRPVTIYWANDGSQKWVSLAGCAYLLDKPTGRPGRQPGEITAEGTLRAPMPALVRSIEVSEGDEVERGQTILLLEAMKMEIRLRAPRRARVARVLAASGQTVERDEALVELRD
jgi:biotin carboxyl carrier protein